MGKTGQKVLRGSLLHTSGVHSGGEVHGASEISTGTGGNPRRHPPKGEMWAESRGTRVRPKQEHL